MSILKSAIYGFIVGDCLGVPFEFKRRESFNCTDMVRYGTHNQPLGRWSDDTSMTLAMLDSIKQNDYKININDMRDKFNKWLYRGEYTVYGEVFDCGITVSKALKSGKYEINRNPNKFKVLRYKTKASTRVLF